MSRLRILIVTRLFPSRHLPAFGTFCAERARALATHAEVRVIAPTPWCPPPLRFGTWGQWAGVERQGTTAEGVPVSYPRFLVVPKVATWLHGVSMARSVRRDYRRRWANWRPDVVDGQFAFPDGYAAVKLAERLGCPSIVTCHGTDLRAYPRVPLAGRMLRWTLRRAARVVAVSPKLRELSLSLGCPPERSVFLTNGVDTERFAPRDKSACREQLGLPTDGRMALCVGHLDENKNQAVLLGALATLRESGAAAPHLALVGDGPRREALRRQADRLGVAGLVHFAGRRPYDDMPLWMAAADWLVLASHKEGWPTVYFEAMACGRPVITANVASASAAVCDEACGIIVPDRTPEAFAAALRRAGDRGFDADAIRAYAEQHSWAAWTRSMLEIIESIRGQRPAAD